MKLLTKRGYELLDCASALQKSIRRGDYKIAGYFAHELVASNYYNYVWKRLLTIAAEDCYGIISTEIEALHNSFKFINKTKKRGDKIKGRIFLSKAVIILCTAKKSREPDHLQCLVYDKKIGITDQEIEDELKTIDDCNDVYELPEYTFDVHTKTGRRKGKTKKDFFIQEHLALFPLEPSLFDAYPDKLE